MKLNSRDLHGAPVFTEQGISVGKVASFEMHGESGKFAGIFVSHKGLISGLLSDEIYVPWNQIVKITKEQVVIKDLAIPAEARTIAKRPAAEPKPLLKERGS